MTTYNYHEAEHREEEEGGDEEEYEEGIRGLSLSSDTNNGPTVTLIRPRS
jgi:hypothetical protein